MVLQVLVNNIQFSERTESPLHSGFALLWLDTDDGFRAIFIALQMNRF